MVTSSLPALAVLGLGPLGGTGRPLLVDVGHRVLDPAAGERQLGPGHRERDHDLDDRVPAVGHPLAGRLHQGAHLHGVEPGLDHPEPHAARPEHRVGLLPGERGLVEAPLLGVEADGGFLVGQLLGGGQELVQGRVEQAHRDRQPVHGGEDGDEVLALDEAQLLERLGLLGRRVGQDHAAHDGQAVLAEEHVLGAAQPDALGTELARVGGVVAGVGVGPDGEVALADVVGPRQDGVEGGRGLGRGQRHLPGHDDPGAAVERDPVALVERDAVRRHLVVAQAQHLGPHHGRLAPAPRHDGGVADQAAPGGQDPLGGEHAVHVLGRGLVADQDRPARPAPPPRRRRRR